LWKGAALGASLTCQCASVPAHSGAFWRTRAQDKATQAHTWPGNLREMRNVCERAVLVSGGASWIAAADLRFQATPRYRDEPG
jgi:DNA-binding NtrC family response regulator